MGIVCPHCNHDNAVGALVCDKCHKSLVREMTSAVVNTNWLLDARKMMAEGDEKTGPLPVDADGFQVVLRLAGVSQPLVLDLARNGLVLGRIDLERRVFPDVDLSPFKAEEYGVSRRHARLTLNTATREVEITDMGSLNGTFINGQRLSPNRPRFLNSGDEVRLAYLTFTFFYRD